MSSQYQLLFNNQHVPTTVIKLKVKKSYCPEKQIIKEARHKLPKFWSSIRKTLLLVSTHMPCTKCQAEVANFLKEKRVEGRSNKLFLYLAHLHPKGTPSSTLFIEWIKKLEHDSIDVHLQPLPGLPRTRALQAQFKALKEQLEPFSFPDRSEETIL